VFSQTITNHVPWGSIDFTFAPATAPGTFSQVVPISSCNGANPQINVTWSSYTGAVNYKVLYLDPDNGSVSVDNNYIVSAGDLPTISYNFTPPTSLTPGRQYAFIIAALDGSNVVKAYSDSGQWSHIKYGSYTVFPNCTPPAPTLSAVTNQCVNRPGADDNQITFKFDSTVSYSQTFILYVDGVQNQITDTGNPYIDLFLTPGETHNFTARAQTANGTSPVSNTINLVGKNCAVVTPPPAPNLSVVTNQCVNRPGTDDNQITFRFDSAAPNIQSFLLYVDGVYSGSATVANPYIDVFLSPGENHNFTGKVQTTSGLSPSSNSIGLTGACRIPTVNFRIDTLNGVFPAQSFPVNVNQNTYAMLRWDISNGAATSVTASTIPAGIAPYWNGPLDLVSGQALVDTSVPQTIQFYITVSNATGSTGPIGLQLNINKYPGPYIQTTGGGVHTNETINISP